MFITTHISYLELFLKEKDSVIDMVTNKPLPFSQRSDQIRGEIVRDFQPTSMPHYQIAIFYHL